MIDNPTAELAELRCRIGTIANLLDQGEGEDQASYDLQCVMMAHRIAISGRVKSDAIHYDGQDYRDDPGAWRQREPCEPDPDSPF